MNLFCFTLEGSTESIYEPPYRETLKKDPPKNQCSPGLHMPEWGGSDPNISSDPMKAKRNNRRSCVQASVLDNETLDKDNYACWVSSGDKKELFLQMKEACKAPHQCSMLTRGDGVKDTQVHLPAQGAETAAEKAESIHMTRRRKKLQNLVQTKKGHPSGAATEDRTSDNDDVLCNNNPVLTCIGLGKRTEKKHSKTTPSPQQQQQAADVHADPEEGGGWSPRLGNYLWNPFECPQPWTPFYHTCHQPQHELLACGGTLSLPRMTEWDRFECLIQELDSKQSDLPKSPLQMIRSITDLQLSHTTFTRFGRFDAFRQPSPVMKPQDNESTVHQTEQKSDPTKVNLQRTEMDMTSHTGRKHVEASPEKLLTAMITGNTQRDDAEKKEVGGGRPFSKGHRRSSNSVESLYSLNSGQSSSSGVTSGSGFSSNRNSLRLEDDLLYNRQLCGRARVHTDFVPSPYDTESLKLKVGDVIDIIANPPMGIWTGMLNGRMGNFKFIYVDVLTEERPDTHKDTQKSTVQEVLKRLSMEDYFSSLQLNGYQTVDDLMRLREHHLTELNVTDPEHRHRLLAAVNFLQHLHSDSQLENEANQEARTPSQNTKADLNNCPRDSGCHMPSDCTEDTDFISESPLPAETAAS